MAEAERCFANSGLVISNAKVVPATTSNANTPPNKVIMDIGYFRDMNTVKPLIDLFHSKKGMNDEIRAITLTALGYIAEESRTPILKKIATHYNYHLRKFEALLQIVKLL